MKLKDGQQNRHSFTFLASPKTKVVCPQPWMMAKWQASATSFGEAEISCDASPGWWNGPRVIYSKWCGKSQWFYGWID